MKNIGKALIKALFVVILPLTVTYFIFSNIITRISVDNSEPWFVNVDGFYGLTLLVLVIVWANAMFYTVFLEKTKVLPKISFATVPMVGVAIGFDNTGDTYSWIILLPFVSIEFRSPYEN